MFDSELLDHRHGSLNANYLKKIENVLQYALNEHPRTLAVRVDLRLSPSWSLNDTLTCHPNLQADLLSRFVCSVKAKIRHYRKMLLKEGKKAHACTPRYFWVKESDSAEFPHYHLVMFFNKDLFRGLGRFDSEENNLASMIRQAWLSALDLKGYDEYQSLVHFPKNGVYILDRNAPDFVKNFNSLVFRLSYLAKENTKVYSPNERSMGASQKQSLPAKQQCQYFLTDERNPLKEYRRAMLPNPAGLLLSLIIQRENKRMNTKTSAAAATTLLNADDPLIDMHFITAYTNMTDKWFYKLIAENQFPKPIKLGRSSRWRKSEVEAWMQERMTESRSS